MYVVATMHKRWTMLAAVCVSLAASGAEAQPALAPTADAAVETLDDAGWRARYDALLRASVRGEGVDYAALRARRAELVALHEWLAAHGPTATSAAYTSRDARLAYWINAYNLTVLRGVVEAPASMRNVMEAAPDSGFFRAARWRVDGRTLSLDAIEHVHVRPVFRDPRVHVALNCAARSCPPLRGRAYEPAGLGAQLDGQARRWLASGRAARVDEAAGRVTLSQLFAWFAEDFSGVIPGRPAGPVTGPLRFVHAYADTALRQRLDAVCGPAWTACTLDHTPYDWALNDTR